MNLPARPQTFGLENCRDVHAKLEWEIGELKLTPSDKSPEPLAYRAFNCAVTAWQLVDWAWADMTDLQKKKLALNTLSSFARYCQRRRSLYLCRHIATASKHARVDKHPDGDINVSMSAEPWFFSAGDPCDRPLSGCTWKLIVHDGNERIEAHEVFDDALRFWDHFLMGNKIGV